MAIIRPHKHRYARHQRPSLPIHVMPPPPPFHPHDFTKVVIVWISPGTSTRKPRQRKMTRQPPPHELPQFQMKHDINIAYKNAILGEDFTRLGANLIESS